MKFSFIHTADIHLGRAFSDIDYELSTEQKLILKTAHEKALQELCEYAIRENVDFVLVAGDTFDACEHDLHSRLILCNFLKRLESENIRVYMVCGNHDPEVSYSQELEFQNSANIVIFGVNKTCEPLNVLVDSELVARVYPFGFKTNQFANSPCGFLTKAFDKTVFNIGLIHCDITSDNNVYAPCSERELLELDYDYYALGHIHKPIERGNIVYSGTIQGRSKKDVGEHGFRHVIVDNNKIITNDFIMCDKVRYYNYDFDISEQQTAVTCVENMSSELTLLAQGCELAIVNLSLRGVRKFNKQDVQSFKTALSNANIVINEVQDLSSPEVDFNSITSDDMLGQIIKMLNDNNICDEILERTNMEMSDVLKLVENFDKESIEENFIAELKYICAEICGVNEE